MCESHAVLLGGTFAGVLHVLDVDHDLAGRSEHVADVIDVDTAILDRLSISILGEKALLHIDYEQCRLHKAPPCVFTVVRREAKRQA